ncbi:hypothetical protein ON010_g6810 [Phytophthora cinnamomi]|nr:hypothetical protein ON010_g6810 [Phytophthora cinnamomi]
MTFGLSDPTSGVLCKQKRLEAVNASTETLSVVRDCYHKFGLFLGHRVRVVNQQLRLCQLFDSMKPRCIEDDSSDVKEIILDKEAVAAFVEAAILAVKRDLPTVTNIIVQLDNASSYQNAFVALVLPIIAIVHCINISGFVHTETQDGKSMLDAHFAQGMRKATAHVQQGNDCYTPRQLVAALTADNGLLNCIAALVEYGRDSTSNLRRHLTKMEKSFSQLTGRVNEMIYDCCDGYSTHCDHSGVVLANNCTQPNGDSTFSMNTLPCFGIRAYAYSGIGEGVSVLVNPQLQTCTLASTECSVVDKNENEEMCADISRRDSDDFGEYSDDDDETELLDVLNSDEPFVDAENEIDDEIVPPTYINGIVTTHAKRSLLGMKLAGDLAVIEASAVPMKMIELGFSQGNNVPLLPLELNPGWAKRPPKGSMYGANYTSAYKHDIDELFQRGVTDSLMKYGPGKMLEELQIRYPDRFNMPSIDQMKLQKSSRHDTSTDNIADDVNTEMAVGSNMSGFVSTRKRRRSQMDSSYSRFLTSLVKADPTIKPASAVATFRSEFPGTDEEVTNLQIRKKFSALKSALKRRCGLRNNAHG